MQSRALQPDPAAVRTMFDAIAPTYDLLNRLMSFGMDVRWRRRAVALLSEKRGGKFLDIAAGSGDCSLDTLRLSPSLMVASDFSERMLEVFRGKLDLAGLSGAVRLVACDALSLPFKEGTFDAATVAFGVRNFADRPAALREMLRVLKPSGLGLILELTRPTMPGVAQLYSLYAHVIIPLLGRAVSRNAPAYTYLPGSIAAFPPTHEFLETMEQEGFRSAQAISLSFGAATIFLGRKP